MTRTLVINVAGLSKELLAEIPSLGGRGTRARRPPRNKGAATASGAQRKSFPIDHGGHTVYRSL